MMRLVTAHRRPLAGSRRRVTGWCSNGLPHHERCHGWVGCRAGVDAHPGELCTDNPGGAHKRCDCLCHRVPAQRVALSTT